MIAKLRTLWQEAFGDSAETLDAFFATGFSPDRCHYLMDDGELVSALYWLDCSMEGKKLAYLYAVATKKACRGRGLGSKAMARWEETMRRGEYAHLMLSTQEDETAKFFYEKLGYRRIGAFLPPEQDADEVMYLKKL